MHEENRQPWRSEIITDVAVCPPAVRTMLAIGWAVRHYQDQVKSGTRFHPVVAVRSVLASVYVMPRSAAADRPAEAPTHDGMATLGWSYAGQLLRVETIFADPESGRLRSPRDLLTDEQYAIEYDAVACTWPAEEDEQRLEGILKVLEDFAQAEMIWRIADETAGYCTDNRPTPMFSSRANWPSKPPVRPDLLRPAPAPAANRRRVNHPKMIGLP